MKISELIKQLEETLEEHGDLPVCLSESEYGEYDNFHLFIREGGKGYDWWGKAIEDKHLLLDWD